MRKPGRKYARRRRASTFSPRRNPPRSHQIDRRGLCNQRVILVIFGAAVDILSDGSQNRCGRSEMEWPTEKTAVTAVVFIRKSCQEETKRERTARASFVYVSHGSWQMCSAVCEYAFYIPARLDRAIYTRPCIYAHDAQPHRCELAYKNAPGACVTKRVIRGRGRHTHIFSKCLEARRHPSRCFYDSDFRFVYIFHICKLSALKADHIVYIIEF